MNNRGFLIRPVLTAVLIVLVVGSAQGRTWYVNTMGTGDAPTLPAAMDSATAGDTVLVAQGAYAVSGVLVPEYVTLLSESGPVGCSLEPEGPATPSIVSLRRGARVSGFTIGWAVITNIYVFLGHDDVEISYNIIPVGGGWSINLNGNNAVVHHNTIISGPIREALFAQIYYNILLGAVDCTGPPYGCNLVSVTNACAGGSNFGADPLFCGPDNYYLRSDSPALPENSPVGCSSYLGALPMGCQVVPVETKSWGAVKALYEGEKH